MKKHNDYYRRYRFKPSIDRDYAEQGYIYFTCLMYDHLDSEKKEKIRSLCRSCAKDKSDALFAALTTQDSLQRVAFEHFMDVSTLIRYIRKFYTLWDTVA